MHDFVNLVDAVAWPIVTLVALLLLRNDIADLLGRIKQLKINKSSVALDLASEIAQRVPAAASLEPPEDMDDAQREFDRLAAEYRDLDIGDLPQRVIERRRLADRLGVLALQLRLDRRKLADGHEGERVAFATACLLKPRPGDLAHLLAAATPPPHQPLYRFTGYRIVLALMPGLSRAVSKHHLVRAERVLDLVEERAAADEDKALRSLIDRTRAVVEDARSRL